MSNDIATPYKPLLFKFLEPEYTKSFLDKGEIFLPLFSSFADESIQTENDKVLTQDAQEGSGTFSGIVNYNNQGDADPVTASMFNSMFRIDPGAIVSFHQSRVITDRLKPTNELVYCVTHQLHSDSLCWALDARKTTCIMILDPEKFVNLLKERLSEYKFIGFHPCYYTDSENDRAIYKQKDIGNRYFIKPKKYITQSEARLVLIPHPDQQDLSAQTICIPELTDILIEIDISGVDESIVKKKKEGRILMEVVKKDSQVNSTFTISEPFGIYSPLISTLKNIDYIGFGDFSQHGQQESHYINPSIKHAEIGVMIDPITMFCLNKKENVKKIIVRTKEK